MPLSERRWTQVWIYSSQEKRADRPFPANNYIGREALASWRAEALAAKATSR